MHAFLAVAKLLVLAAIKPPQRRSLKLTRSSSGDEIANVNCFTITSCTYYKVQSTIDSPINIKLWHTHRPQCHTVFTVNRKQQGTITTLKRNLNDKLQVSNGEIQSTRICVNLVTYTNFTALCVTEAEFWSISSMLDEAVVCRNARLAKSLK